jgi:hypothetical protein
VLILVPEVAPERDVIHSARVAARLAWQKGLMPMYPQLYCYPFMTPEEMDQQLPKVTRWWLRRVSKVWMAFPGDPDNWRLDSFSYELLAVNRSPHRQSLPICALHRAGDSWIPLAMSSDEIDTLLIENATAGMIMAGGIA